ncbi:MAG: hypothetical protein L0Y58_02365 [Verrucomicrobia subdivision 3 bacterium]|nr:hypothetical protein [Limisphaerales bacterium]
MTAHPTRHVRTLRLKASSEDLVRRGAILLEDALHTATLPDAGPGRLLIIRSLDFGVIRSDQSPSSIALRIEEILRHLGSLAVHAEAAGAASRPAVYFRNSLEAIILLARRSARQEDTGQWFWPLAVKAWRREMPRHEALRTLLGEALRTELGAVAGATMLRELYAAGAADELLGSLGGQDGVALLRLSGLPEWSASSFPAGFVEPHLPADDQRQTARWLPLIMRWVGQWGAEDARSLWLAATALLAENPGRQCDPRLSIRTRQLVNLRSRRVRNEHVKNHLPDLGQDDILPHDRRRTDTRKETPTISESICAQESDRIASLASDYVAEEGEAQANLPQWHDHPRPSEFGGLLFLLPVMVRLGMPEWLGANPEMIEIEFPHRLLRCVASLFAAPDDDPILSALSAASLPPRRCEFIVPVQWIGRIAIGPLLLRRIKGGDEDDRAWVLCDKTGLLPLALWRGRAPLAVREAIGAIGLRRGPLFECDDDPDLLLRAWITAMRRWCRRYAGIGLRQLVCRPGRVLAKSTHLDLIFDLNQAEMRIRRSGLDLNPGWLPWFGRVVTFHYLPGESTL